MPNAISMIGPDTEKGGANDAMADNHRTLPPSKVWWGTAVVLTVMSKGRTKDIYVGGCPYGHSCQGTGI